MILDARSYIRYRYKQNIANLNKMGKATTGMQYNTKRLVEDNDIKEKYIKTLTEILENIKEQNDKVLIEQEIEKKWGELKMINF